MRRLFVRADWIVGDSITIEGGDALHLSRSLRMAPGERVVVCDMQKREYVCEAESFARESVTLRVLERRTNDTEPPFRAYLYQALPKGDKLDTIVQKAVELGVSGIIPFVSERCISRPDRESAEKKRQRLCRIAREAAMQCGRGVVPEVFPCVTFSEAVSEAACAASAASPPASAGVRSFICYEGDGTVPLGRLITPPGAEYRFLVGAEGGFSLAEVAEATDAGLAVAGLGRRILRCETAGSFVLSCLTFAAELT